MNKFLMLLLTLGFLVSCQEYVAKKRDGMKPFYSDDDSRQAQEE